MARSSLADALLQRQVASLARVVRIPRFFSPADIEQVGRVERAHHERLGRPREARPGWHTTYLSAGGLFRATVPELHRRLSELRHRVDVSRFDGGDAASASELLRSLNVRCIELHDGRAGGSLNDPRHFDNGSTVTVDVLLEDSFTGGAFGTTEAGGALHEHEFSVGDALVFPSYKYHSVGRITGGRRRTLVLEFWQGDENRCNHRCELIRPRAGEPYLCEDAQTSDGCAGRVSVTLTAPGPLGLGFGFGDAADPENVDASAVGDGRPVRVSVTEVRRGSQAEAHPRLVVGLVLTRVAGVSIGGMSLAEADEVLGRAVGGARPLALGFEQRPLDLTRLRLAPSGETADAGAQPAARRASDRVRE